MTGEERAAESGQATSQKGRMPPIEEIPEPPRHYLYITSEDGSTLRFVNSDHETVWTPDWTYLIVRCGLCGHESSDHGAMKQHAWMGQERHHSVKHVGRKTVWKMADVAEMSLAELSKVSRFRHRRRDEDVPEPVHSLRGDTPSERVREIVRDKLGDEPAVVVHQPPSRPYPGSIEETTTEGIYVA